MSVGVEWEESDTHKRKHRNAYVNRYTAFLRVWRQFRAFQRVGFILVKTMSEDMKRSGSAIRVFWILLGRFVAAVSFQVVLIYSHVNVH